MPKKNIHFNYQDKVAIVTGAGQGIGRAVAIAFAAAGARVVVTDINLENADSVLKEIISEKADGLALQVDVSDSKSIENMVSMTVKTFNRIDILVNNAGIAHRGDIFTLTEEGWDRLMAVNVKGVWLCSREVLKVMIKNGSGRIINIGSISGWLGGHEVGADYAVSKAGVAVLTKRLANEMAGRGTTVNSVAPHAIETPMTEGHGKDGRERIVSKIPVKRFGRPEEVAASVLYLASEEAGYITGQTLHVNGGTLMVY